MNDNHAKNGRMSEAEERTKIMLDATPLCSNFWDENFNNIDCNQEAVNLFELSSKQEYLDRFYELSPEFQPNGSLSKDLSLVKIKSAFATGRCVFEWMHQKLNGEPIPTEITLVRVKYGNRDIVVGYTRDLRSINESLAKMQEADERVQIMLDATPLCCNFWDKNYNNIDCNQEAVELFELTDKREYLDRFFDLSPEYQPCGRLSNEVALENIKDAFANGRKIFEWMHQKLNGELIPAEITLVRVKLRGEFCVVGYTRDLRELKATLAKMRQADERTQIMLDATPLCCNLWDENGNNVDCNQEAVSLFNLSSKQEYLDRFFDLSPEYQPDGRLSSEKAKEKIAIAFETGKVRFEWMHQKLNGELIPAEITLVRVKQGDKFIVTGYTRDLRELKHTIETLNHLEKLAFTDSLTGAYNRRYFMDNGEKELYLSNVKSEPFSIIMLDIDKFKNINDTFGHPIGDEVLKLVVSLGQSTLRQHDTLARYGGEEFLVMVTNSTLDIAVQLAERIREKIAVHRFDVLGKNLNVTVSLGVATKTDGTMLLSDLIEQADKALYKAKKNGRNRVEY